jgi:hypothetical protein
MGHLGKDEGGLLAQQLHLLRSQVAEVLEGGARNPAQRHEVEDVRTLGLHGGGDIQDMVLVDAGEGDGVDLQDEPLPFEGADGRQLLLHHHLPRVQAPVHMFAVAHPGIDAGRHGRVHGIDRDRDMAGAERGQVRGVRGEVQAVAGHAQEHFGVGFAHPAQGLQGLFRLGKGIARPGDADHGDAGVPEHDLVQIAHSLGRGQDRAGHAGAGFVETVELAVAEVALDVALGSHRQVDPAEQMPGGVVETGMFAEIESHAVLLKPVCVVPADRPTDGYSRQVRRPAPPAAGC